MFDIDMEERGEEILESVQEEDQSRRIIRSNFCFLLTLNFCYKSAN